MSNGHSMGSASRPATLCWLSVALLRLISLSVVDLMLLIVSAIFLVGAASCTIPSVSLLMLAAGIGSIILEVLV